jgi:CcmD family protein
MNFLYAAFIVTWVIHIFYLFTLNARVARVRKEARELKR